MSRAPTGSRSVFVGNIPYDMSEEQLTDVFKEAGPVVSFRLMFDRETGKPRGYGFCEFLDAETAASAVRNLNNYDVGGRQLRVDYADNNNPSSDRDRGSVAGPGMGGGGGGGGPPSAAGVGGAAGAGGPGGRGGADDFRDGRRDRRGGSPPRGAERDIPLRGPPAAPAGPPNLQAAQQGIANTLGSMNPNQLFELMTQMKSFIAQSPEQAHILLSHNPQLSYALLQGLLMMNLVDASMLQRILQTSPGFPMPSGQTQAPQQQQPLNAPPSQGHPPPQAQQQPGQAAGRYMGMGGGGGVGPIPYPATVIASGGPVAPQQEAGHRAGQYAAPPAGGGMTRGGTPQPQQGASQVPPAAMNIAEQQKQLLLQVLNLTPEQINMLPPDQRASVQALKQQLLMQGAI